jgi:hypothetical protein
MRDRRREAKRIAPQFTGSRTRYQREERVTAAYVYTLLRLPWLAPDITTAIVNGRQPPQLNAKRLMRLTAHLPADWAEQRVLLGFRRPTHPSDEVIALTAPVKLKRAGREMKMLVDARGDTTSIDMSLLRIVARAHDIKARLTENTTLTVHDIAWTLRAR